VQNITNVWSQNVFIKKGLNLLRLEIIYGSSKYLGKFSRL